MNQNHPTPTAACAAFAALLPLAGHDLLNERDAASLRAHLATCAACRAELAIYDRVELAWSRALAPRQGATPLISRATMLDILTTKADRAEASAAPVVPTAPPAPLTPRRQSRRFLGGLSALAAVLLITIIVGAAFLARGHNLPGPGSANPSPTKAYYESTLGGIAMVSPDEGWAVGGTAAQSAQDLATSKVLLLHYLHGVWSPVQLPLHGYLTSISMDSPTDGWAVGQLNSEGPLVGATPLLLHYDGQAWKRASFPAQDGNPQQVQMLSSTDGWLIGSSFYQKEKLLSNIWHYDGRAWTAQPLPGNISTELIFIARISMISPTEGWAILEAGGDLKTPITSFILHYTGGRWQVQRVLTNVGVQSISMLSAADGWIAAEAEGAANTSSGAKPHPVLLHYTGEQWVDATTSISDVGKLDILEEVFMRSPTDGWIISQHLDYYNTAALLRYNGTQWTETRLPALANSSVLSIRSIAMTSPTEGWAVGDHEVKNASGYVTLVTPTILHFHNGTWGIVQS